MEDLLTEINKGAEEFWHAFTPLGKPIAACIIVVDAVFTFCVWAFCKLFLKDH